jgi:thiol-disulfide isomerase/thioredoxin
MTTTRKGANPYDKSSKPTSPVGGDDSNKMAWIIGGVVVAVIVVIAVVVFATGGDDGGDSADGTGAAAASNAEQQTATVTISGEDLPPLDDSANRNPSADPAVGLDVPSLTGQSFDGSEVVIDGEGGPTMVVFLAHWCPNCQAEVPVVQEWIDSGDAPEELEIVSVSTAVDSSRPNYPPSSWLSSEGWVPQVLLDDEAQSAASSWGLPGYPYFVLVDADGKVWYRASGQSSREELNTLANDLVSGASATAQAGEGGGEQTPASLPATQPEG